jgi:hypothetical protein
MDPLSVIMEALGAGASAALKDSASQAVKDAYASLKSLVQRHFANKPEAQTALEQYEKKPLVWEAPLKDALGESELSKEIVVVECAQRLLRLVQPQQVASGKYNLSVGSSQGMVVGDKNTVDQHFGRDFSE